MVLLTASLGTQTSVYLSPRALHSLSKSCRALRAATLPPSAAREYFFGQHATLSDSITPQAAAHDLASEALGGLKWSAEGLIVAVAQNIDTGEVLMQAFADRNAVSETLQTGLATFYSRSRKGRWCKGETSGHFIHVTGVYADCDGDSLIYQGVPVGPACHTGARTCWFSKLGVEGDDRQTLVTRPQVPLPTLLALEDTIRQRKRQISTAAGGKPSWTAKLLQNPELLCRKVREEAGELCQTLEQNEGRERAASEMADLLYHSMVLLNVQEVEMKDVLKAIRSRFGTSGIEEKASRVQNQGVS